MASAIGITDSYPPEEPYSLRLVHAVLLRSGDFDQGFFIAV